MHSAKYLLISVLIVATASIVEAKKDSVDVSSFPVSSQIDLLVQPLYQIKANGGFETNGTNTASINRAKIAFSSVYKSPLMIIEGLCQVDFSTTALLQEAFVNLAFSRPFELTAGRFKAPFGLNLQTGSTKLWFVHRTATSDFISDQLSIGSFQNGIMAHGKVAEVSYQAALIDYEKATASGLTGGSLFSLPIVQLAYKPIKNLKVRYVIAAPLLNYSLTGNAVREYRTAVHDAGVEYSVTPSYEVELEAFLGDDTVGTIYPAIEADRRFSLNIVNSYLWNLAQNGTLRGAIGVEWLSGEARSTSFVISQGVTWYYTPDFFVQISHTDNYSKTFSTQQQNRFSLQLSYSYSAKLTLPRKKGDTAYDPD